jgi:hypothetical protein
MKPQYYQTGKFKASLVALFLFLAGTAGLLYFTVTECLQECSRNNDFPNPCLHDGKSYCCVGSAPNACLDCVEESYYCTEFIVGSAACFILAIISFVYLCMVRKVHLKNVERSNWSGMASMATYKAESEENSESNGYRRQK